MTEDGEDFLGSRAGGDPAAIGMALGATPETAADARAYLREQTDLARLQKANLLEQNSFELSHLRWRRFNDQMKGALQILTVLLGLVIVAAVAAAMWNASRAEGLVVDAFSVPPALSQTGVGGDVVADDMTSKIAAIRDFAEENSLASSNDVSEDRAREIKVDIPETGVSLAEVWRYLRRWLGNERHLTGNLRNLPDGRVALTASLDGAQAFTFAGAPGELDALEQKAAERVFAAVDPNNIVLYLVGKGRTAEALAAAARNVAQARNNSELAGSYALLSNLVRYYTGDTDKSLAETRLAIALAPGQAPQHMEMLNVSRTLGHDEEVLAQARAIAQLKLDDNVGSWRTSEGFPYVQQLGAIYRPQETGDFAALAQVECVYQCAHADTALLRAAGLARMHDGAGAEEALANARSYGDANSDTLLQIAYFIDADAGHWSTAADDARGLAAAYLARGIFSARYNQIRVRNLVMPMIARALAGGGDVAAARENLAATPLDCYGCLDARGVVETAARDWLAATNWFDGAVRAAPSVPFAYTDWGAMLVHKGDYDAAIAKFTLANQKGPHFADPLELWGEALMLKNRSDLALAKFEDADKYAPNWGRLHMKWGEALGYVGRKDEASEQYRIATRLELSQGDRAELARDIRS